MAKDFAAMEARGPSGNGAARNAARAALRSRIANPSSIRLEELQPNPRNPRYSDDDPDVQELAETLLRVGQLQPAVVVPLVQYRHAYPDQHTALGPQPWVVIVGNRRLAAARLAGRAALDVRVDADLENAEDIEDRILIENIQRKDLPPLLEAEQLQRRLTRPGQTVRSVGAAIGKSHAYVQQRIDLLRMIPEFQELLRRGEINIKTGRQLGIQPPEIQQQIFAAGPPYSPANRRPAEAPAGNPVSTEQPSSAPVPPDPATVAGNPVTGEAPPSPDAGDPASGSVLAPAGVNPVSTETAPPSSPMPAAPGNPVSTDAAGDGLGNGQGGNPVSTPDSPGTLVANARTAAAQWLDNALTELDRALPAGGDSVVDQAFADARRYIQEARHALGQVTLEGATA